MSTETLAPADVAELRNADSEALEAAFAAGVDPDLTELDGVYRGRLISVRGFDLLPSIVRSALDIAFGTPLMPWRGKRFGGDQEGRRSGANVWLTTSGPDLVWFDLDRSRGGLLLDYDVSRNPAPLRIIKGDVRRLAPGLYLGRMSLRIGQRTTTVLWFTLDNA
jgi:hypothetical protein